MGADLFKILVIDDSPHARRVLARLLSEELEGAQVDTAGNGQLALAKVGRESYDLITLDLNMPVMDGYTFLRIFRQRDKTPVLAVSSVIESADVELALELGANGFMPKPSDPRRQMETVREELRLKVKNLIPDAPLREIVEEGEAVRYQPGSFPVVVVGCSSGGPPTLQYLLSGLPDKPGAAVIVAQHMPDGFTANMTRRLDRLLKVQVRELADGMTIEAGTVYFCPGGHDVVLAEGQAGKAVAWVTSTGGRTDTLGTPSVDKLFESAATLFGARVVGFVLTGMGRDGAQGVRAINAAGGRVLAEAESTAAIYGMPREAMDTGCVDEQLPLPQMAIELIKAVAG